MCKKQIIHEIYFEDIFFKIKKLWQGHYFIGAIGSDKWNGFESLCDDFDEVDYIVDFDYKNKYNAWESMLTFTMYRTLMDIAREYQAKGLTSLDIEDIDIVEFEKYYLDNLEAKENKPYLKKYLGRRKIQTETILHLIDEYKKLNNPTVQTAIKYSYQFNKVDINIYFDAWDPHSLNLILVLNYAKKSYLHRFNIKRNNIISHKLDDLKDRENNIYDNIAINGDLTEFYHAMGKNILANKYQIVDYNNDIDFKSAMDIQAKIGKRENLFWYGIKKVTMSDRTLNKYLTTTNISEYQLKKIQTKGLTIVRTRNINKRAKLALLLKPYGIILKKPKLTNQTKY